MFKIYEIHSNNHLTQIHPIQGIYTVHELGRYKMYYSDVLVSDQLIYIEDECMSDHFIKKITSTTIETESHRFFEDHFGFARISINNQDFQFNILGEKLNLSEIQDIVMFLYEKDHSTLDTFVSKSATTATKIYEGKDYLYSSKYLNLAQHFISVFENLFAHFKSIPHRNVRRKLTIEDYSSALGDHRSIEWLFQNLDTVEFDYKYKAHPNAISFEHQFGLVEKISVEKNILSFDTYENNIILGSFQHLRQSLSELQEIIETKLNEKGGKHLSSNSKYVDFRDLKKIPFLKFSSTLIDIRQRLDAVHKRYTALFKDAKPLNQTPKHTTIFLRYRHYQEAFKLILQIRSTKYDLNGEIQLLNVRKLSELYELYNLHAIIDCFDKYLEQLPHEKEIIVNKDSEKISCITYKLFSSNKKIRIFYTPKITDNTPELDLVKIGTFEHQGSYCCPDFVIEINEAEGKEYLILDAKYSSQNAIKTNHLFSCVKKYLLNLGVKNAPYQKPRYFAILHPDSTDMEQDYIKKLNYYPQISTIISKPNKQSKLQFLINSVCQ